MRALAILASCHFCSQYPGAAQDSRMPRSSRVVQIPVPEFREAGWQERTRGVGSCFPGRRRLRRRLCF
jgi:hypothetical protein